MVRSISYIIAGILCNLGCVFLQENGNAGNKLKNFCYFTNWSPSLANFEARFDVENINATLCSHLIYAFANMDVVDLKLVKSEIGDDNGSLINKQGRYFEFNKLKIRHSELVTLLSIGGANGKGWFQVVASETSMQTFATKVAIFLRDRDFDGIDLDWEYPLEVYRNKFTQLLQVFRREFENESMQTSKPRLIISIAVGVSEDTISKSYNIPEISSYVDYIQVMAYDFHGPWSQMTSFSSPLFSRASNIRFNQQYSQQWAIDRWISGGAPRHKLVLGLTGIATTFTLANITDAGVGAAVAGPGKTGPYLGHEGHATYYRVCELIRNGAVYRFDEKQKMSYAVLEDQWAGYPTPKSMKEKVRFAYSRGLAGTMFWSLEVDDFKGTYCNTGQFPLLTAVYDTIQEMAPYAASGQFTVRTTERPPITTVDIGLQHKTNKNVPKMKSFCYFTNWSPKYANLDARMDVRDVNTSLCSHLVYAFADIDRQNLTLVKSQPDDDDGTVWTKRGRYFTFNKLKADCPGLKTLLSVGGAYGHGFPLVVVNADAMRTFARNAALYARDRDFDGIDIDWEYPRKLYREKFLDLIKVLRTVFEEEAARTANPRLLLTIAVAAGQQTVTESYNIPAITRYVDYIQVMAYDFHGPWSHVTSFSSPLYSRASNNRFNQQNNQAWAIDQWISGGAQRDKLVLGLTGQALTFTLADPNNTWVGASVVGPGTPGPYLGVEGRVPYYRVCELIQNGAVHHFDGEQKMAYAVLGDQWIGYPTPDSMKEKVLFAHSRRLAGTMFWSLEYDDFLGSYCRQGEFPLLTAVHDAIQEVAASPQLPI